MTRAIRRTVFLSAVGIAGLAAALTTASADADRGRYVMEKTENGYVRMDTATGDISICHENEGQIVCRLAADERAAFQDRLDELEARLDRLEERVAADGTGKGMPSDEEFDRGLDNMEKFFDRFLGIIERFDDKQDKPDRT